MVLALVLLLQIYVTLVTLIIVVYIARHVWFTLARVMLKQRPSFQDMWRSSDWPRVTIVIPMHNEELVAEHALKAMLNVDYPHERLQVIPINDHSSDATMTILNDFADRHPLITPLHRDGGNRGKPSGLNDALALATGEIIVVFDADYEPPRGLVRMLVQAFTDPEVGAVMGRVVPQNPSKNLLTRLLDLERSGGYQVDQQARHALDLIPQYGGTVGGFRRKVMQGLGGFDPRVLAEDTDLTFRLYAAGWKVAYVNRAECYEEAPEDWGVRYRQLRRWARGHNQVMLRRTWKFLSSPYPTTIQKIDGALLLGVYMQPLLILTSLVCCLVLFMLNALPPGLGLTWAAGTIAYSAVGNLAPFYQIGAANVLDGMGSRLLLLPMTIVAFVFNMFAASEGAWQALQDLLRNRDAQWEKTVRFKEKV